jgi:hypothetical protein
MLHGLAQVMHRALLSITLTPFSGLSLTAFICIKYPPCNYRRLYYDILVGLLASRTYVTTELLV